MTPKLIYFEEGKLAYIRASGQFSLASLSAKAAEWMTVHRFPVGHWALCDFRKVDSYDESLQGIEQSINLLKKLYTSHPPAHRIIALVPNAEIFAFARNYQQQAFGILPTEFEVFRQEAELLRFINAPDETLDAFMRRLLHGDSEG